MNQYEFYDKHKKEIEAYVKNNYKKMSWPKMSIALTSKFKRYVSEDYLRKTVATHIGIDKHNVTQDSFYAKYKKSIEAYVRKNYKDMTWPAIAKHLTEKFGFKVSEEYLRKKVARGLGLNKSDLIQKRIKVMREKIKKETYNKSDGDLARDLGISENDLRMHRRAMGVSKCFGWRVPKDPTEEECQAMIQVLKQHHKLKGLELTNDKDLPMDMLLNAMSLMAKATSKLDIWKHEVSIEKTDTELSYLEWVLLYFIGDLHIGSQYTKIDKITEDFKKFKDTTGLLLSHVGDGTDNFLANHHPVGLYEQMVSPQNARRVWRHLWNGVADKTLFMISGCHDLFSKQQADMDMVEEFAELYKLKYLGSGGKVFLNLAGIVYNIFAKHKSRWNSGENAFHACLKNILNEFSDADICCIAHNHISAIGEQEVQGRMRVLVRSGTYKPYDQFAKKIGFTKTDYGCWIPGVLLNTQKKEWRTVNSIDDGLKQLKVLNGKRWI